MSRTFPADKVVQRLAVPFEFPVYFTRDLFHRDNPLLAEVLDLRSERRVHRALVCADAGVVASMPDLQERIRAYFDGRSARIILGAPMETVQGGETAKHDMRTALRIIEWISSHHLCRQSYVIAIGGGSVLDVVGLAASLVHRGLRLVRVPTTVEAQNDVGVGVKNGVDAFGVKNLLGTFAPPFAVLNDFDFLDTLSQRDWVAGIAEAFKVAMIKDAGFFEFLCANAAHFAQRDRPAMETLIRRCACLHLDHIREGGDPFEMGAARQLDFGHWSSHQLEVMSGYAVKHGEAVAIGIALDSYYAWRQGLVARSEWERLIRGLQACGLPIWHPLLEAKTGRGTLAIMEGLERFREHLGGELTITLPVSIGARTEIHEMDPAIIAEGVGALKSETEK